MALAFRPAFLAFYWYCSITIGNNHTGVLIIIANYDMIMLGFCLASATSK
ncbi:hypothetical protein [Segatella hominis]